MGWQGEANTDEGYTRTRAEYACQMKLLITSWRKSWGYDLPFFWCVPCVRACLVRKNWGEGEGK